MKQKRMFKRQRERHPVKWLVIAVGLFFLSFASFGAGVQFATLTIDQPELQIADTAKGATAKASAAKPVRVAHQPEQDA